MLFLTGKFFRSRAEAITISPMHPAISPDLSLVIRMKNDAFARDLTWKVTRYPTRTRDNSRGISSDTARNLSLNRFIYLSRGNSRGILIKAFLNTSLQGRIHTPINNTCNHLITHPFTDPRPKGRNSRYVPPGKKPKKDGCVWCFSDRKNFPV